MDSRIGAGAGPTQRLDVIVRDPGSGTPIVWRWTRHCLDDDGLFGVGSEFAGAAWTPAAQAQLDESFPAPRQRSGAQLNVLGQLLAKSPLAVLKIAPVLRDPLVTCLGCIAGLQSARANELKIFGDAFAAARTKLPAKGAVFDASEPVDAAFLYARFAWFCRNRVLDRASADLAAFVDVAHELVPAVDDHELAVIVCAAQSELFAQLGLYRRAMATAQRLLPELEAAATLAPPRRRRRRRREPTDADAWIAPVMAMIEHRHRQVYLAADASGG